MSGDFLQPNKYYLANDFLNSEFQYRKINLGTKNLR